MSAGHSGTGPPRRASHGPRNAMVRVLHFFESKVGFAILTFLLTSGLGTLATWLVTEVQQSQAARTVALQARAAELGSLHTGLEAALLQREIAADAFMKSIERGAGDAEIGLLWQRYEDLVRAETQSALQSHLIITGHTEDGPDPGLFEGKTWLFWRYLSDVVQPRFDSMHDCLLDVHSAYVRADEPLPNKLAQARTELSGCKSDSDWDAYRYSFNRKSGASTATGTKATDDTTSVSGWDGFKSCVEDFAYLLDMSTRLQARAGQDNAVKSGASPWNGCGASDDVCRERNFLNALPETLRQSCGQLDLDFE